MLSTRFQYFYIAISVLLSVDFLYWCNAERERSGRSVNEERKTRDVRLNSNELKKKSQL